MKKTKKKIKVDETGGAIPFYKPMIREKEKAAARAALELGWLGMGSYVGEFEKLVSDFLELPADRHAVAVNTCYSALHVGLVVAGVKPGDEVITPAFNNISDFQAILAVGAKPVFCDILDSTLCIDLDKAEKLVSKKTKAIIVMDHMVWLCDHDRVAKFAKKHNLRVIHDAAHAFGSSYKGKKIGSFSDIATFSFDPVKTITCIDAGIVVVKGAQALEMAQATRNVGMDQKASVNYKNQRAWRYDVRYQGFRYHLANLHAAIGGVQMREAKAIIQSKREVCRAYTAAFRKLARFGVRAAETDYGTISPLYYPLRVRPADRDALRAHLKAQGVDTGFHWDPGHHFTLFKKTRRGDLSITDRAVKELFSLPVHSYMPKKDVARVIAGVRSYYESEKMA